MFSITLPLSYLLSGFFMKISDDEFDEKSNTLLATIFGIVCGVFTGLACSMDIDAACIFIAILVGNILAKKVDGIHHIVTMIAFLAIFILLGIPKFTIISFIVIIICIIGTMIDEWGNDNEEIYERSKFLMYFFDFRFALKVVILAIAIIGLISPWSFLFFLCFEIGYELARRVFNRFFL